MSPRCRLVKPGEGVLSFDGVTITNPARTISLVERSEKVMRDAVEVCALSAVLDGATSVPKEKTVRRLDRLSKRLQDLSGDLLVAAVETGELVASELEGMREKASGDRNAAAPSVPATGTEEPLLIWWTTQEDFDGHDMVDERRPEDMPSYAWQELCGRYGRSGRGRLWVPAHIELSNLPVSEDDPRWTPKLLRSGGVVIEAKHAAACEKWGGCITNLTLDPVTGTEARS